MSARRKSRGVAPGFRSQWDSIGLCVHSFLFLLSEDIAGMDEFYLQSGYEYSFFAVSFILYQKLSLARMNASIRILIASFP